MRRRAIMQKILAPILIALLIGVFAAGCGEASSTTTTTITTTTAIAPSAVDQQAETLVPIHGDRIKDGRYAITVSSSSSMFRIIDAQLIVKGGKMSAVLTLSGHGYEKLYMGTGEQALADTNDKCIYYVENAQGKYTYTVPVEALDKEIDCAAWSIRNQKWYDRVLVFQSSSIPKEALAAGSTDGQSASEQPADGQYVVEVSLEGGSGRATIQSPTELTIEGGDMTAVIRWSSPNYDFMLVDGIKYLPTNTEGNSTFEIPVSQLDSDLAVSADTTAMSQPYLIDYTLHFDSRTLKAVGTK
jgi:hypothetical protein